MFVTRQSASVPVLDEALRNGGIEGSGGLIPQILNLDTAPHEVDIFTLRPFFHSHLLPITFKYICLTFRRRNYFFLILAHLYIKCE